MFLAIFQVIWHHLQVYQEHLCPLILLLQLWRTGRVLTKFYMSNNLEIFTQCFWPSFKLFDTISKSLKTPAGVLEDMNILDALGHGVKWLERWPETLCENFKRIGHVEVSQDSACPSRLQQESKRTKMFLIHLEMVSKDLKDGQKHCVKISRWLDM